MASYSVFRLDPCKTSPFTGHICWLVFVRTSRRCYLWPWSWFNTKHQMQQSWQLLQQLQTGASQANTFTASFNFVKHMQATNEKTIELTSPCFCAIQNKHNKHQRTAMQTRGRQKQPEQILVKFNSWICDARMLPTFMQTLLSDPDLHTWRA